MKTFKWNICGLVLFLSLSLWNGSASAQSSMSTGEYVSPQAAEGMDLNLTISESGELLAVRITECDGCMPRTFLPAPDVEVLVDNEQASIRQAAAVNGRGGTVLYDRETGLAEVVIFYGH